MPTTECRISVPAEHTRIHTHRYLTHQPIGRVDVGGGSDVCMRNVKIEEQRKKICFSC